MLQVINPMSIITMDAILKLLPEPNRILIDIFDGPLRDGLQRELDAFDMDLYPSSFRATMRDPSKDKIMDLYACRRTGHYGNASLYEAIFHVPGSIVAKLTPYALTIECNKYNWHTDNARYIADITSKIALFDDVIISISQTYGGGFFKFDQPTITTNRA